MPLLWELVMRKTIELKNVKTSYIEEGRGKPLIILHGWGASIEAVMSIVNILKDTRKVYAIDGAGFGMSDAPDYVYGTYDYAEAVKEFIEKMSLEKPDLIGHSFGGKTLIALASKYPELVGKLVMIDASGIIPKRKLSYYLKVYSFKILKNLYTNILFWKNKEESLKSFYKKFGSDDYKNSDGIMRKVFVKVVNEDMQGALKKIEAETLLIWGDEDKDTPLYMGKIFEREIKNSGLVVLRGGHYSYADDYATFRAVIKSFLG